MAALLHSEAGVAVVEGVVVVDGAMLEGGGQVVRAAIGLGAALRTPCRVVRVRAGRPKPGLSAQHVAGLSLLGPLSRGAVRVEGCEKGSTECEVRIIGEPSEEDEASAAVVVVSDTKTPGSVSLVLQAVLPLLVLDGDFGSGARTLRLCGGTTVPFSPPMAFSLRVLLPALGRLGIAAEVRELVCSTHSRARPPAILGRTGLILSQRGRIIENHKA